MSTFSTLRSRRFASRQTETTQQIIAFLLGEQWFALPILAIQKIVPVGKVYDRSEIAKSSVITYEDRELLVVDLAQDIFKTETVSQINSQTIEQPKTLTTDSQLQNYLVILQSETHKTIAFAIDAQPAMYRIKESDFQPLSQTDSTHSNIHSFCEKNINLTDSLNLFFLSPKRLSEFYSHSNIA